MMEGHLSQLHKMVSQKNAPGWHNEFRIDRDVLLEMANELHGIIVQEIEETLSQSHDE